MNNKLSSILIELFIVFILLMSGWKYTYAIDNIIDIGMADESNYLWGGAEIRNGEFTTGTVADSAPLYTIWYYLLSLWRPDRIALYYFNYKVLAVLLPVLLYILLRRYELSIISSVTVSFFFMISCANLWVWPKVSHFSAVIVLSSFILASCAKSFATRAGVICIGGLLSSYVRPEMFLAFTLLSTIFIIAVFVEFKKHRSIKVIIFLAGIIMLTGFMIRIFGWPARGNRAFVAFGQHFSLNWVHWTGNQNISPWNNWRDIIDRNFGNIHNMSQALINNPNLFFKHMASNIMSIPKSLKIFLYHTNVIMPVNFREAGAYLLLGIIVLYILLKRNRLIPTLKSRITENSDLLLFFSCYLMVGFVSVLFFYPRHHYLIIPGMLIIVMAAIFLAGRKRDHEFRDYKHLLLLGALVIAVTPSSLGLSGTATGKPNLETIKFIRSLSIDQNVNLLEANGGFHIYLGDNFSRVAPVDKESGFNDFIERRQIKAIVLTDGLMNDTRFKDDEDWKFFLENYKCLGWTGLGIPNTNRQFIVDSRLLK